MAHLLQGDSLNYMYLLQEREFIKTKEAVYKVGKTTKVNHTRFNQYPKGSILLFQIICQNCNVMEPLILNMFKEQFFKRIDIGNEYFEGDCDQMIHIIYSAVREEKMCKQHLQPTIPKTNTFISQELKQIKQQEKEARQKYEKEKKLAKIQKLQERIGLIEHYKNETKANNDNFAKWFNENMVKDANLKIALKQIAQDSLISDELIKGGMKKMGYKYDKDLAGIGQNYKTGKYYKGGYVGIGYAIQPDVDCIENNEVVEQNVSIFLKWIVSELQQGVLHDDNVRKLYDRFLTYSIKHTDENNVITETAFGIQLNLSHNLNINMGIKRKTNGCMMYCWNIKILVNKLKKMQLLNDDFVYNKQKENIELPVHQWLCHLVNTNNPQSVLELSGTEAHDRFNKWNIENNFEYSLNRIQLGMQIKPVVGITKGRHTDKGQTMYYDMTILKSHLIDKIK